MCQTCGENRETVRSVLGRAWCPDKVKFESHRDWGEPAKYCAECWRKCIVQKTSYGNSTLSSFYCGSICEGRCVSKTLVGADIKTHFKYIWHPVDEGGGDIPTWVKNPQDDCCWPPPLPPKFNQPLCDFYCGDGCRHRCMSPTVTLMYWNFHLSKDT